jgi:glucuronosyltransferase
VAEPLGNFLPPSIVPLTITDLSDKMTFGQRSKNFLYYVLAKVFVKRNMMPEFESVYRDHLGDNIPSYSEILSNASMIFANGHFAVNSVRPSLPDLVDIGGIHCRQGKKLPEVNNSYITILVFL